MARPRLEEAVAELVAARYLLLRPTLRGGGDTLRVIEAEDALHRAYLGEAAEGVPKELLFAAAARKAGLPLLPKDADALSGRLPAPEPSGGPTGPVEPSERERAPERRRRRPLPTLAAVKGPQARRKKRRGLFD